MYLHYVYKGSSKNSLTLFHLHKQKLAIEAYKEGLSKKSKIVFELTTREHFGGQLFDKMELEKLEKVIKTVFPPEFKGFEAAVARRKTAFWLA
mmetsp:Transcript_21190/g.29708  ORF Transcript_21190/g.29708 Transcript_21190/m.29708 type:complete len:93 (+) Transcript_21190:1-279(+)